MAGKICMITGATSGIGFATATALAAKGATTIIVGRNPQKCINACNKIRSVTGNDEVESLVADLSSQKDIRRIAGQFAKGFDRLDVLVNNAGAKFVKRYTTSDGYEMTFALNHLAYFLLTKLMLDHLHASGNARIINVSSGSHSGMVIDFSDLQCKKEYIGKIAYGRSKLANLLFTYELDRRLKGSKISVNAMAPGGVITNFCKNNGWISWGKHVVAHILARNLIGPQTASDTIVYLSTSSEVEGVSGKYYYKRMAIESSPDSYDESCAKLLWDISNKLTGT